MEQQQKGLLFAGDLFVRFQLADGSFIHPRRYECDKLEIATPSEPKEKKSKGRSTYGQAFVTIPVPQPTEFAITFAEVDHRVFAAQLSGLIVPIDVEASVLTNVEIVAALDEWIELGVENIAEAGFSVTNAAGDVTYVEGEDYEVNRRLGMLRPLSTGDIVDASTLKVSGAGLATTGTRIVGATRYRTVMQVKLDGVNLANNQDVVLKAPQAVVASDSAYDFLQSEISEAQLKGKLEIPGAGLPPFTLDYPKTAS